MLGSLGEFVVSQIVLYLLRSGKIDPVKYFTHPFTPVNSSRPIKQFV